MKFRVIRSTGSHKGQRPCTGATGSGLKWFYELSSIDELVEFIDKNGVLILGEKDDDGNNMIEIYDGYRE